jgi:hypothetical protein
MIEEVEPELAPHGEMNKTVKEPIAAVSSESTSRKDEEEKDSLPFTQEDLSNTIKVRLFLVI